MQVDGISLKFGDKVECDISKVTPGASDFLDPGSGSSVSYLRAVPLVERGNRTSPQSASNESENMSNPLGVSLV